MPDYRDLAAQAARRYGLGDWFVRQIGQESGFNPMARSSAGAEGIAQVVPRWHPDAPRMGNPAGQLDWAAKYMAGLLGKYGNPEQALSVYNSGRPDVFRDPGFAGGQTYRYVKNIMGGAKAPAAALPAARVPASAPSIPDARVFTPPDLSGPILANLTGGRKPTEQLSELVSALMMQGAPAGHPLAGRVPSSGEALSAARTKFGVPINVGKWAKLAQGADRPGASTQKNVLDFVARLGKASGTPLTIGTGTNHSRMTVNGNVSNHWDGHAADIPASGQGLRRLGYLALREAGMPEQQARKAQRSGGLFNVGPYQVIFATTQGGNHFNHLHVGVRR